MPEPNRFYRTGDDWLGPKPAIDEKDIAETYDADIIVLGGGHAGTQLAVRGALILIHKPPFYACVSMNEKKSHAKVGLNTLAGVMTDIDFNVTDENGEPIRGLYVAGNTLGQRFGISYVTPCAGSSIGSAMTNGYFLTEILAGCAKRD